MALANNPVITENQRDRAADSAPQLVNLLIGGRDVAASNRATFERSSPVSGDLVTLAAAAGMAALVSRLRMEALKGQAERLERTEAEALDITRVWLATDFEGGRHLARIKKIDGEA